MTSSEACEILERLIGGLHPVTGEILPDDHVCADPLVLRALHKAILSLQKDCDAAFHSPHDAAQASVNLKNGLPNAGRSWTKEDDDRLRALFYQDATIESICQILARRPRGVMKRLTLLRLWPQEGADTLPETTPGLENAGMPWYEEDDEKLTEMFECRTPLEEIMAHFKRSKGAIESRMVRLGLIENKKDYLLFFRKV